MTCVSLFFHLSSNLILTSELFGVQDSGDNILLHFTTTHVQTKLHRPASSWTQFFYFFFIKLLNGTCFAINLLCQFFACFHSIICRRCTTSTCATPHRDRIDRILAIPTHGLHGHLVCFVGFRILGGPFGIGGAGATDPGVHFGFQQGGGSWAN